MLPRPRRTWTRADVEPQLCTVGAVLCRVRVFTQAEWDALPESERPATREHVPGLGWVAAVPIQGLN